MAKAEPRHVQICRSCEDLWLFFKLKNMVKLRAPPPLLVGWRPDARGPLVLIHVVDFHMYRLGLSRIVGVDPHGAYADDAGMSHLAQQLQS